MSTRTKKKKQVVESKKTKVQERQVIYWAIGITGALLILSYFYFKSRF